MTRRASPTEWASPRSANNNHYEWNGSQQPEVTAYVQRFLIGGAAADTNVLKTDGAYTFDQATWVDWDVPMLQGQL